MPQDLSASTLEAVRKSLTVTSFMILVYHFADGNFTEVKGVANSADALAIKLPLTNVIFNNPDRLLYVVWGVMIWMMFRYFQLGAWQNFKKSFWEDWGEVLLNRSDKCKKWIEENITNNSTSKVRVTSVTPIGNGHAKVIVFDSSDNETVYCVEMVNVLRDNRIILSTLFLKGSAATFVLPIFLWFLAMTHLI